MSKSKVRPIPEGFHSITPHLVIHGAQAAIDFYKKVQPFGPGWKAIHLISGVSDAEAAEWKRTDNIPLAMVGWVTGTVLIWSALFTVGNFLYGRWNYGFGLLAIAVVSGAVLIGVVRRIWR